METGQFIEPKSIVFSAAAQAGDREFKFIPRGFYYTLIQEAFRELNMDSLFMDARKDYNMPPRLVVSLPEDCISVVNVYAFTGDVCNIQQSKKIWWKRNYYTNGGGGYIANNKGNNQGDPFLSSNTSAHTDRNLIRWDGSRETLLWYEIENGSLMLSSSCLDAGTKVHIQYKSSGGDILDAPIIPVYFESAMKDFVTEAALRLRMASEPSNARIWMAIHQLYERRLDKNGMDGSWHTALMRAKKLSASKLEDLKTYLGKAAWATGR